MVIDAGESGLGQAPCFGLGQLTLRNADFRLHFVDIRAIGEGTFQTLFKRQALACCGCHGCHGPQK